MVHLPVYFTHVTSCSFAKDICRVSPATEILKTGCFLGAETGEHDGCSKFQSNTPSNLSAECAMAAQYSGSSDAETGVLLSLAQSETTTEKIEELAMMPHTAYKWTTAFEAAGNGTSNPFMTGIHQLRQLIWYQTEYFIQQHPSELQLCASPETVTVCLEEDILHQGGFLHYSISNTAETSLTISVIEQDLLEAARGHARNGESVAVLNMANDSCPGGGVYRGAGAQEENLHRRSDAFRFTIAKKQQYYPIRSNTCLLSKDVTVFRGPEADGYPVLTDSFKVSVISCPAIRHPSLDEQLNYRFKGTQNRMRTRICVIAEAIARSKCSTAILSAFGCGAFGNPPRPVANMFRDVFNQFERKLSAAGLRRVLFCIIDDHNARRAHNPEGNFRPFQQIFGIVQDHSRIYCEWCKPNWGGWHCKYCNKTVPRNTLFI